MSKSDAILTKDRDLLTILLNAKDADDAFRKLVAAGASRTQAKHMTFGMRYTVGVPKGRPGSVTLRKAPPKGSTVMVTRTPVVGMRFELVEVRVLGTRTGRVEGTQPDFKEAKKRFTKRKR